MRAWFAPSYWFPRVSKLREKQNDHLFKLDMLWSLHFEDFEGKLLAGAAGASWQRYWTWNGHYEDIKLRSSFERLILTCTLTLKWNVSHYFPSTENIHLNGLSLQKIVWLHPVFLLNKNTLIMKGSHARAQAIFFFFSTCSHFYLFICFLSHTLLWGSSWIINVELLNAPYSGHRSCSERLPRSHSWLVGAGLENKSTTSVQQHRHTHLRCTGDAFAGSWWKISPHHK